MRNLQIIGLLLVVVGSFLPLVHLPIIGNWNYWKIDHRLAMVCWALCLFAFVGILMGKQSLAKISTILLIILFLFTLVAIKLKSLDYFSFLHFKSLQETASGIAKLSWGWFFEFSGAILMFLAKKDNGNKI